MTDYYSTELLRDCVRHCEERAKDHDRTIRKDMMLHSMRQHPRARESVVIEQRARAHWSGEALRYRLAHNETMARINHEKNRLEEYFSRKSPSPKTASSPSLHTAEQEVG